MRTHWFSFLSILAIASASGPLAASAAYIPAKGTYSGLFYENSGLWQNSSGFISIQTTAKATYSLKIQMGKNRYGASGRFYPDGSASLQILRRFNQPLTIDLQVDSEDPDLIFGTITDGEWTSDILADRAVFDGKTSFCPDEGRYTVRIPGDLGDYHHPGGDGFGTITIDRAGRLKFAGELADGSKISQATTVSKGGQWPFYVPAYGYGSLYGWMLFNASAGEDLSGDVTWIKPEMGDWYYPDGFAVIVTAEGSRYAPPPKGGQILDWSVGTAEFNGANLYSGITNSIVIDSQNKVTNLSANGLSLKFKPSNGTFSGTVQHPITWEKIKFRGAVLQRFGVGAGYFLLGHESGEVWLQSE